MADNIQTKSEATLVKKVWDIANVLAAAGVGFTDYITQLTYVLFLKMDDEKESLGLGSSIAEGYKWKELMELNGPDLVEKYEEILSELAKVDENLLNDIGEKKNEINLAKLKLENEKKQLSIIVENQTRTTRTS